jgi:hypothetical protein
MEDVDVNISIQKGSSLNTVEKYSMYKKPEQGVQINDESIITKNKISDVIVQHDSQMMAW